MKAVLFAAALTALLPITPSVADDTPPDEGEIILSTPACLADDVYIKTDSENVALAWGMAVEHKITSGQFLDVWTAIVGGDPYSEQMGALVEKCLGLTA